ncbi:MAG: hypothetical protein V4723_21065 [Pseudomonadota bacterium]
MKKLSLICVALLLTACGGSGGGNDSNAGVTPVPPTPTVPTPSVDMFYATVAGIVNLMPDDTEPGDVSNLTPTLVEDTEPTLL